MIGLARFPYRLLEKSLNFAFDYGVKSMVDYGTKPMVTWTWKWTWNKCTDVANSLRQTTGWLARIIWGEAPDQTESDSGTEGLSATEAPGSELETSSKTSIPNGHKNKKQSGRKNIRT